MIIAIKPQGILMIIIVMVKIMVIAKSVKMHFCVFKRTRRRHSGIDRDQNFIPIISLVRPVF